MKTPSNRWFSLALAVPAFVLLTGAKGEGCTNSEVVVEPEPPIAECEAGFTAVTICPDEPQPISSDSASGSGDVGAPEEPGCYTECIPDEEVCPEGTVAVEICSEYVSGCQYDGDEGCVEPPSEGECWISCEPVCPAGTHSEWVCAEPPISSDSESGSGSADEPAPPPEQCTLECVPDACPPGYYEIGVCEASMDGTERCWTECVPEQVCPPGCYATGECPPSDGSGAPEEECVTLCVCDEPSEPPPDEPQAS